MCRVDYENHIVVIDKVEYLADVPCWYDGAWDYYIKSEDIYLRSISDIHDDVPLWAMFKGKGPEIIDMNYEDLFNTHKIWTPITNREYQDVFTTI